MAIPEKAPARQRHESSLGRPADETIRIPTYQLHQMMDFAFFHTFSGHQTRCLVILLFSFWSTAQKPVYGYTEVGQEMGRSALQSEISVFWCIHDAQQSLPKVGLVNSLAVYLVLSHSKMK